MRALISTQGNVGGGENLHFPRSSRLLAHPGGTNLSTGNLILPDVSLNRYRVFYRTEWEEEGMGWGQKVGANV